MLLDSFSFKTGEKNPYQITFYQILDLKKEGEECGHKWMNGATCSDGLVYGICEEGLVCFVGNYGCAPGTCEKIITGKLCRSILILIKPKSLIIRIYLQL